MFSRKGSPSHPVDTGGHDALPAARRVSAEQAAAPVPGSNTRACCCPASPRVRVLIPFRRATGEADEIDVLLCAHHYRTSLPRLNELGVVALGLNGCPPAPFGPAH